jgi:membrane-bound lytic murein transglycosylase B
VSDEDVRTELAKAIAEASRVGRWEDVRRLTDALLAVTGGNENWTSTRHAVKDVQEMTRAQLKRRGRAVSKAKAEKAEQDDSPAAPLLKAFSDDPRFGSLRAYARVRRYDRSSLSAYANGVAPCPSHIDRKVREDFPSVFESGWTWPKGVTQ